MRAWRRWRAEGRGRRDGKANGEMKAIERRGIGKLDAASTATGHNYMCMEGSNVTATKDNDWVAGTLFQKLRVDAVAVGHDVTTGIDGTVPVLQ